MIQVLFPTKTLSHNKPAISKVGVTTPRCFRHQHPHRQGTNKLITAKGFTFFGSVIGDSYKSSFGTGTWRGPHPKHISYSIHTVTKHQIDVFWYVNFLTQDAGSSPPNTFVIQSFTCHGILGVETLIIPLYNVLVLIYSTAM